MTKRVLDLRFFCPEVTRSTPTFAAFRGLAAACVVGLPRGGAARMGIGTITRLDTAAAR